jgi:prephenate dehydrogenase
MLYFKKVVVIGVGLIGGSLAMVLKEKAIAEHITGIGRGVKNLEVARNRGIIDDFTLDAKSAVDGADLIILATPVCNITEILKDISPYLKRDAIVTDVGSVKKSILDDAESVVPEDVHFVAGHPIAGTEDSGSKAAFSTLFNGRICILTPTQRTDKDALEKVTELWREAGSDVILMDADKHDMILAAISHLPHVVVYALVNTIARMKNHEEDILDYSAGGFVDFTRIASSSPEMWRDICLLNRKAILDTIARFQDRLEQLKGLVKNKDAVGLFQEFNKAKVLRDSLKTTKNKK